MIGTHRSENVAIHVIIFVDRARFLYNGILYLWKAVTKHKIT